MANTNPRQNAEWPKLEDFGDESFPVIHPVISSSHHVEIGKLASEKLAPNSAVLAELDQVLGCAQNSKLLCSLKGGSFLCIHNSVIDWESEQKELQMLLPPSRIAIRSSFIGTKKKKKKKKSSRIIIYAPCLAAIEFLGLSEEDELQVRASSEELQAGIFRSRGREKFLEGEFVLASIFFSSAAAAAESNHQENELLLASSNHAQCMLNLRRFEEAISSCEKALSIDPHHSKSLFRKAQALSSLQLHRRALETLRSSLDSSREVKAAIARMNKLVLQQEIGSYDVLQFFLSGFDEQQAPECSDFSSDAVEIRITGDGRGRGLFLTRDVDPGELLLVSNPVAAARRSDPSADLNLFLVEALRSCGRSRRALRIINSLAHSHSMASLPRIESFIGSDELELEDEEDESLRVIDPERVKRVLELAAFQFRLSGSEMRLVFGLPALINHSCTPNSSLLMIGGALFTRAAMALGSGEEITIAYTEILAPLEDRSRWIRAWGFECRCRRCEVERLHNSALSGLERSEFRSSMDPRELLRLAAEEFREVEGAIRSRNVSEEERGIIRVAHINAYWVIAIAAMRKELDDEFFRRNVGEFEVISGAEVMGLLHEFAAGHLSAIVLVARMGVRMIRAGERFEEQGSNSKGFVSFHDALAGLMGKQRYPQEAFLKVYHLLNDDRVVNKLGVHAP